MTAASEFSLAAADGTPLAGTLYQTPDQRLRPVLIAGGLGIPQRFYVPFAKWLASSGRLVMTFDLRGMGASRSAKHERSLRGLQADILSWARCDFSAAVSWLSSKSPDGLVNVIGHSLGAHHAAMTDADAQRRIGRLVAVASGAGYWRDWSRYSRIRAPLMLHLAGPILTGLLGWFPGKRLGMVGDLPGPAARQWMRWCRHPEFAWGAEPALVRPSLASARFSVDAFSFTDDDAMTELCCRKLLAAMPNAPSRLNVIAPQDLGMRSIGHVGAFRKEAQTALWPLLAASLDR